MNDPLLKELRTISTLLRLGFSEQITARKNEILSDDVNRAILESIESLGKPVSSPAIHDSLTEKGVQVVARTVRGHLASLVEAGVLERVGQGHATEYQSTDLIQI